MSVDASRKSSAIKQEDEVSARLKDTSATEKVISTMSEHCKNIHKSSDAMSENEDIKEDTKPDAPDSATKVKPFPCPQCKMRLTTEERLVKHIDIKHVRPKAGIPGFPVRKHLCTICGHGFRDINRLRCHERIHNNERPFECTQCGQTCFSKEYLRRHELRHVATRREYVCNLCGNKYASSLSLKEHIRNHTGERPFECKLCDSTFNRRSSLRNHVKLLHIGNVPLPFQCTVCDKQFRKLPELTVHTRVHTDERPYVCHHCARKFRTKQAVQKHEHTHNDVEGRSQVDCKYCDKKLCSTMSLSRHVLTVHPEHVNNTKKLKYVCNVCNKVFPGRACLNLHAIVHTGVRPFACDQCNKSFNRKANLRTHELTHIQSKEKRFSAKPSGTGEKVFACSHCDKKFDKNWNLRVHEMRHTSPTDNSQVHETKTQNGEQIKVVSALNIIRPNPLISEQIKNKTFSKPLKQEDYIVEQKVFVEYKPEQPVFDAVHRSTGDIALQYSAAVRNLNDTDASCEILGYDDDDNNISDNDDISDSYQYGIKMDIYEGNNRSNTSRYAELQTINRSDHSKFVSPYIDVPSHQIFDVRGMGNQSVYLANKVQQYSSVNNVACPENYVLQSEAHMPPVKLASLNDNMFNNFTSKPSVVPSSRRDGLPRKTENRKLLHGSVKQKSDKGLQCRDCKKWFKRRTQLESHGRLRKHNVH